VLYRSAKQAPERRFHALFDKVARSDVMWRAWGDVRANKGAPGVDGVSIDAIEGSGVQVFLEELAAEVRAGRYRPQPLRRVHIPKPGRLGQTRPLGIPTVRDRVVMGAAKIVLEPVFEADFLASSFGFRPRRSAHMAIEAIRAEANRRKDWVLDADIKACFDEIDHDTLMVDISRRVIDRQLLKLLRCWLRAGIFEGGVITEPDSGTPQGSPISPLLANIALHRLDQAFQGDRQLTGRLVRYADDCVPRMQKEESSRSEVRRMQCCTRDEGARPSGLVALRGRSVGGGRKPPRGAPVKSRGAERRGDGALSARQVWITKASESEPPLKCRKRIDGIRNRGRVVAPGAAWREPADWPGGCPAWMVARA